MIRLATTRVMAGNCLTVIRNMLSERTFLRWLGVLLIMDALLIFLHIMKVISITMDGGVSELFENTKIALAALCYAMIFAYRRRLIFLALAVIFILVFADNTLTIHESLGKQLQVIYGDVRFYGMHAKDLGELLVFGVYAALSISLLGLGLVWSDGVYRTYGLVAILSLCILGGFAVGIDFLHAIVGDSNRLLNGLLNLIEDGGELVAISIICATAFAIRAMVHVPAVPASPRSQIGAI